MVNTFIALLQDLGISPDMLLFVAVFGWLINQLLRNFQTIQYFVSKSYRFKSIDTHKNTLEAINFIDDDNLKQLYRDSLKGIIFEKAGRIQFYPEKKRELFLELYPKLKEEFSYDEFLQLKNYFFIKNDRLEANPRGLDILQNTIYLAVCASLLISLFMIFSIWSANAWFIAGWFWASLLLFIAITLIRMETMKKVKRLRLFFREHYKA